MNNFKEFAQGIIFKYAQPMDPTQTLEVANTLLPEGIDSEAVERIKNVSLLTKLSTFAIGSLLHKAVQEMPADQCYLNIGIWHGYSLFAAMVGNRDKECIGVDNFSEFGDPRIEFINNFDKLKSEKHKFFEMDYQYYFENKHQGKIGVYFYDAKHEYDHQLNGLKLAEPFLADDALIFVDDWNWEAPRKATADFIAGSQYTWEMILDAHTYGIGNPTFWNGLAIFKKLGRKENV
jgi:hypothetical protein